MSFLPLYNLNNQVFVSFLEILVGLVPGSVCHGFCMFLFNNRHITV